MEKLEREEVKVRLSLKLNKEHFVLFYLTFKQINLNFVLNTSAMSNKTILLWGQALTIFNQHWFKIGLVALGLYAFLSRDFSFRISIQAPSEIPSESYQSPPHSKKQVLTDNGLSTTPTTNHFDFIPSWGEKKAPNLIQQLQEVDQEKIKKFIQRFGHVARTEEEKYGIPTSIILANALLQSSAGTTNHATIGNNYFALVCSDSWNGGSQDGPQGCIRRYDNAWQSFRDYSLFLTTGPNTGFKKIDTNNLSAWANALGQINSETDDFDKQLLYVIKQFGL